MVGNGLPASSYGACSVTAGAPKGQRAATRRNARGGRPSCCSTSARSSIPPIVAADVAGLLGRDSGPFRGLRAMSIRFRGCSSCARETRVRAAPLRDALDDEEPLAGADEAHPPRLARERLDGRGVLEPRLQAGLAPGAAAAPRRRARSASPASRSSSRGAGSRERRRSPPRRARTSGAARWSTAATAARSASSHGPCGVLGGLPCGRVSAPVRAFLPGPARARFPKLRSLLLSLELRSVLMPAAPGGAPRSRRRPRARQA